MEKTVRKEVSCGLFFIVRKVFSVDSGCGILFGYLFITVV